MRTLRSSLARSAFAIAPAVLVSSVAFAMLGGCGSSPSATTPDSGTSDASTPDSGSRDAGTVDSGDSDAATDAGSNQPPVAANATVSTVEDTPLSVTLPGTDPDGDPITWTIGAAAHGTITGTAPSVTYTPTADYSGNDTVSVQVSDGSLSVSITVTIVVTPIDDAPVAVDDTAAAIDEDTVATIPVATLLANDTDVDTTPLTIASVAGATNGTVSLNGANVVFAPSAGFSGNGTFTYTIGNGGSSDTATVTVPVSSVVDGVVANDDSISGTEDAPIVISTASLLANDLAGDVGTVSFDQITTQTGVVVSVASGTITVTAPTNFSGDTASFDYRITDGATTDVGHVAIHVDPAQDAPVAIADSVSASEDTPVVVPTSALLANDTDADGDMLSVVSVAGASSGAVSLSGAGITFTPAPNASGNVTFSYTITDGSSTSTATVTVAVAAVDDAPVAVNDVVPAFDEDTVATIAAGTLLANDSDVDSLGLAVTFVSSPVNGTVSLDGTTITFSPNANFNGAAAFVYTVTADGKSRSATVALTVNSVVDPAVANDDSVTGTEDSPITIDPATLLANDQRGDGAALTFQAITGDEWCAASFDGTSILVTCPTNFNGTAASFDYQVTDGVSSAIATVALTVTPANDAPDTGNENFSGTEDTPQDVTVAELLANDADLDGDTLTITSFTAFGGATVTRNGDTFTFVPARDVVKNHGFAYTVSDGALTTQAFANFWLAEVNDAPTAVDDYIEMSEDSPYTNGIDLLRIGDPDPDSEIDSIHVVDIVGDAHCDVTFTVGGDMTVTPGPANWNGSCVLTYTVSDGFLSDTGSVFVTVDPWNDAPIGNPDTLTVAEDSTTDVSTSVLLANDTDAENDTLRVVEIVDAVDVVIWLGDGRMTVIPTAGFTGTATFRYRVEDASYSSWADARVVVTPAACGDGTRQNAEQCDDANEDDTDGCLASCNRGVVCNATAIPGAFGLAIDSTTGHCYAGFVANKTWTESYDACHAIGGQLAVIESAAEVAIVDPIAPHDSYLGVTDWATEDTFTGLGNVELSFFPWTVNQPDSNTGNEDCVSMRDGGEWRDAGCDELLNYVCEIAICGDGVVNDGEQCDDGNMDDWDGCTSACAGASRCGDGTIDGAEECDDGNVDDFDGCSSGCAVGPRCDPVTYVDFEDGAVEPATANCYLSQPSGASWNVAQSDCASRVESGRPGSLAVIDSVDENWLVRSMLSGQGWIGSNDQTDEGVFVDPDGQSLNYTNWEPGEPNDSGLGEDCTMMYWSGRWNDAQCTDLRPYVCELQ